MKRTVLQIAAAGLIVCMIAGAQGACPGDGDCGVLSASAAAVTESGTCGENVTWTLDDAGTLTISGTGV